MLIEEQVPQEDIYRIIVEEASILAALYTGPEIRIKIANKLMLQAWGKDESILGKPIREAIPELNGQPFFDYFDEVYRTGIEHNNSEERADLLVNGVYQPFYYTYSYKPLKRSDGSVWGIVHTALDVTEEVRAKKAKKRADEMLRLAVDSAGLGTWFLDVESQELQASERTKELFGFYPTEQMTLDQASAQIDQDFREKVLSAIALAISKGSTYDIEYPITGFHDQRRKWVRATGKLYDYEDSGRHFFAGTLLDITEQKENDRRKDDFISIASHELKTPITSLKASIQLLQRMKENPSAEVFRSLVTQASKSIGKISTLIEDLLNVSRMNQGQIALSKSYFKIGKLLNECCQHVRMEGKHELIVEGDLDLEVYADEDRIDQVVVNMVNNAVKYAPESKQIFLIARKEGAMAKISIKDNGPGIPPDRLAYLFNRYYQIQNSGTFHPGLGLGLYISAEIIKSHGGEIGVESEPGKGATFWFKISLK